MPRALPGSGCCIERMRRGPERGLAVRMRQYGLESISRPWETRGRQEKWSKAGARSDSRSGSRSGRVRSGQVRLAARPDPALHVAARRMRFLFPVKSIVRSKQALRRAWRPRVESEWIDPFIDYDDLEYQSSHAIHRPWYIVFDVWVCPWGQVSV
jgi:hypothetical protein